VAEQRPRQLTIRDVARAAGVAPGTVSKVLTGRPHVSEKTRERVRRVIEKLGYEPDGRAQALATGRTKVIGVVVASLANPFYTELVEAIDHEATSAGFSIFLASTDREPDRERQVLAAMVQRGVDGFVLAHVATPERDMLRSVLRGRTFVLASRHFPGVDDEYVVIDGGAGSRLAVEHLIALGHRRIGLITGSSSVAQFAWRRQGYEAALRDAGIEPNPAWVAEAPGSNWLRAGHVALDRLLELPAGERPTAVHTVNDMIGLGVLQRAHQRGLEVPRDLSVVGFDNIAYCELSVVPLTTVDGRIGEVGARATAALLARIAGTATDPVREVLEPALVVRGSTAPPATP
jgi:DNA-binding LacI/PurR family transcriptional regulator